MNSYIDIRVLDSKKKCRMKRKKMMRGGDEDDFGNRWNFLVKLKICGIF